jgi:hypothetical protein
MGKLKQGDVVAIERFPVFANEIGIVVCLLYDTNWVYIEACSVVGRSTLVRILPSQVTKIGSL